MYVNDSTSIHDIYESCRRYASNSLYVEGEIPERLYEDLIRYNYTVEKFPFMINGDVVYKVKMKGN